MGVFLARNGIETQQKQLQVWRNISKIQQVPFVWALDQARKDKKEDKKNAKGSGAFPLKSPEVRLEPFSFMERFVWV